MALPAIEYGDLIYRLARLDDPWALPDWAYAGEDGTFGNRFDDPRAKYRVLYGSSQQLGCYLETLARFRPNLDLLAELEAIEGENDFTPIGVIPSTWFHSRCIGKAYINGRYAAVATSEWIAHLRVRFANDCVELEVLDLDLSTLLRTAPRALTQRISRYVFECPDGYAGITYPSKFGADIDNWALFEPCKLLPFPDSEMLDESDPALRQAMEMLGLRLESEAPAAGERGVDEAPRNS